MSIPHPIPALVLTTSIVETKIGSMDESIWESQSFLSVNLKPGQLTVSKEFIGTPTRKLNPGKPEAIYGHPNYDRLGK